MKNKIIIGLFALLSVTYIHFGNTLSQNLKTQVLIDIHDKTTQATGVQQNYSYEIISQESSEIKLDKNEEKDITILLRNSGKESWDISETSKNPLYLKSIFPNETNSNIYYPQAENWQSPILYKITDDREKQEIKSGETLNFTFKIKAPKNAGYYKEKFGLLISNKKLLKNETVNFDVLVKGAYENSYSYEYTSPDLSDNYLPNKEKQIQIKLKNTGNVAWYKGGTNSAYLEDKTLKTETNLEEIKVNPGEEGTFLINFTTPSEIGSYEKYFIFGIKDLITFDKSPINFGINITNKKVALTFDDGYGEIDPFIDTLNKYNVKATFFMLGCIAQNRPEQMRRILADGHVLADHSYNHPDFRTLSPDMITWQIEETRNIMRKITGVDPFPYFRYPYGAHSASTDAVVEGNGWKWIHWTNGTGDYQHHEDSATGRHQTYFYATLNPPNTSIVLMHIISKSTLGALPDVIKWYRDNNYAFVTVDEL